MINIKIICVGKIKEKYLQDAIAEYSKRLSRFCTLDILELNDEKFSPDASLGDINNVKVKEAFAILSKLDNIRNRYVISLDETGDMMSSTDFSDCISKLSLTTSTIVFVIGGSLGLSNLVKEKSNKILSFSKMTFPHQLFRVFLLEQLFRSFKIDANEQYHH